MPRFSNLDFSYYNKKLAYSNSYVRNDDISQLNLIEAMFFRQNFFLNILMLLMVIYIF